MFREGKVEGRFGRWEVRKRRVGGEGELEGGIERRCVRGGGELKGEVGNAKLIKEVGGLVIKIEMWVHFSVMGKWISS